MANKLRYTYCTPKRLATGKWRDYWRFRRDGIDTPLPGKPGELAFIKRYAELMEDAERRSAPKREPGRSTFEWLAKAYLVSAEFNALAEITQGDYRRTIEDVLIPALGPERFDCIGRKALKIVRDKQAAKAAPRTANKVKQVASLLYTWAEEEELLPDNFANPGKKLRRLKGKSKSIEIWSPEEIALFLSKCEPHLKTAVILALYTGQRCEDVVSMQWDAVQGGTIRVRQNKTDEPLTIFAHTDLKAHLDKIRTRFKGPILRDGDGKPMNANQLGSAMYRAVRRIEGMPSRSMHGLRYAAAGALEAVGCTVVQITSIIGHRTYQMAMKYASQRREAEAANAKLENRA